MLNNSIIELVLFFVFLSASDQSNSFLAFLFRKQCRDLGIDGVKLKSEIVSLARDLPSTYTQVGY